jgi:hypothetical protein
MIPPLTDREKELADITVLILRETNKSVTFQQLFTDLAVNKLAIQELEKMAEKNIHYEFAFTRPLLKIKLQNFQNNHLN